MRHLLFVLAIAAAPMAVPLPVTTAVARAATVTALGDLSSYRTIVADTLAIALSGDFPAAEKRITDFEKAWDDAEATMRPRNTASWTTLDHAADAALDALRAGSPTRDTVVPALNTLLAALGDPAAAAPAATTFSVTNADGSPVPCETTLQELRRVLATATPAEADRSKFEELQAKGIERCNADDDKRADRFFSEALALLGHRS